VATYTGALASNGLPELATDGTIDFPAMTRRRAMHVTLRDSQGGETTGLMLLNPPGSSPDNPLWVQNPNGGDLRMKLDGGYLDSGGEYLTLPNFRKPQTVALLDAFGIQITSFGGTQYATNAVHGSNDIGTLALAVATDGVTPLVTAVGNYCPIAVDSAGAVILSGISPVIGTLDSADKFEDAIHISGDLGVMALAVRNDSDIVTTSGNRDYTAISTDSTGRPKIGQVVPGTAATHLGKAEDAASADGDTGVMVLGVRNTGGAPLTSSELDYNAFATDVFGAQYVNEGHSDQINRWLEQFVAASTTDVPARVQLTGDCQVAPRISTAAQESAVTVSTTAIRLVQANVSRKELMIVNNSTGNLFVSRSSKVTSSGTGVGSLVPSNGGNLSDSGDGIWPGEWWGIYSVTASSQNVVVSDLS
jgi:hypothetical protein